MKEGTVDLSVLATMVSTRQFLDVSKILNHPIYSLYGANNDQNFRKFKVLEKQNDIDMGPLYVIFKIYSRLMNENSIDGVS